MRTNVYNYEPGTGAGYVYRSTTRAIPDLKPEIVQNVEFGVEGRFIDDRFGVSFTFYRSTSLNQLLKINTPPGTGYYDQYINAGEIRNKGIEVVLNATPVRVMTFHGMFSSTSG